MKYGLRRELKMGKIEIGVLRLIGIFVERSYPLYHSYFIWHMNLFQFKP